MQAVITADIVNSTKLKPKDFKGLVNDIENMFEAPNRVEFYRGDSFQALIAEGADAYRLMLLARLKAITYSAKERTDIRMGISLGTVNTETGHLGSNLEEIFISSGRTFEKFGKQGSQLLLINCGEEAADFSYGLIARYTDSLLGRISAKQAFAMYHLLSGKSQKEIAALLEKSEPTISEHIKKARFDELKNLLDDFENLTKRIAHGK
ncbi:hypothetical protein OGH69_16630 [Flavobacterium sp. MFBS3-15]|uniref:hypothetical protein n=1 Tax=Flavobacterium sp. MFBS3-15 TaxID=2989816 RepID=UPI002235C437|nr:hypothetical protein [Flavobacterium sp. MFBS3-15]MCW4470599.1 hypothetical protein [Flavobacterium sp. MFBS3-15]